MEKIQRPIELPEKLSFLLQPKRYKVAYGGRGSGKSWSFARALLLLGWRQPIRVLCAREFQNSIADSVHRLLQDQAKTIGLEKFYAATANTISGINGTEFRFFGLRKQFAEIKSYEGIDYCWVEEANATSDSSWEVLIPTIRKDNSEIWISFNPELEEDATYQRFVADPPSDSIVRKVHWWDNPWFPAVLAKEKDELKIKDYDAYLHVWEGFCRQAVAGAIYVKELREATESQRITRVPVDPRHPVETIWDLGRRDCTSIWFRQRVGFEWRYVDFYENYSYALPHYIQAIQSRGYVYGNHWLPHDSEHKQIGAELSVKGQLERVFGAQYVRTVPDLSKSDGINAARTIFPLCYFDREKCKDGIQHLRHYHYKVDVHTNRRSSEPDHDEHSHAADAFRYSAVATAAPGAKKKVDVTRNKPKYTGPRPTEGWMT